MSNEGNYHDKIQLTAQRLAHLTARQLIRKQLQVERIRDAQRRKETQWKMALGAVLIDSGVSRLPSAEIFGALLSYRETVRDAQKREGYKQRGARWLAAQKRQLKDLSYE